MSESLRDQLSAAYDKADAGDLAPAEVTTEPVVETTPVEVHQSKLAEAPVDDRPRNPDGTFAPKETTQGKDAKGAQPTPTSSPEAASPAVAPKARPPRPSSWKKDHWEAWDKLDPNLAEYLHERESQFAKGVSTYKQEFDAVKPLVEAMQPFTPLLQQHGIQPAQWITNLGNAHRTLAMGAPQQKLQMFMKMAQDYGVPLQALVDPQAQQQFLQQPQYQQPQPHGLTPQEVEKLLEQKFAAQQTQSDIERFGSDPKNKHFQAVRDTMAGLLQSEIPGITDLQSAYEAALALPQHRDLVEAEQKQLREAEEAQRREQEQQRVLQAKGKAVSVRSATPNAPSGQDKPKGLRSHIEAAAEQHLAGSRV